MKMKKMIILILCVLLFLCACGPDMQSEPQPEYTIGVVLKAMNSQYWMDIRFGMEQAAAEYGADLLLLAPYDEINHEEQKEHIRRLMESDVSVLLVAPCNSYDTAWFRASAEEKEIPVLTVDTRALDTGLPYIGADNENIGRMAADYFIRELPAGSQIAVLSGSRMQSTHTARVYSFLEELEAAGTFPNPLLYDTDGEFSQGYETVCRLNDVDGIFCTSAILGLSAVTAQDHTGSQYPIVAVDTQDDALEAVRIGAIDALVTQSGYDTGYQAVVNALKLLKGESVPEEILLPGLLMTQESCREKEDSQRVQGTFGGR